MYTWKKKTINLPYQFSIAKKAVQVVTFSESADTQYLVTQTTYLMCPPL